MPIILPSQPGTYLIYLIDDPYPKERGYILDPVVAWSIKETDDDGGGYAAPICVSTTMGDWAVLFPDGRVTWPESNDYETIDEYVQDRRERAAKIDAQKAQP